MKFLLPLLLILCVPLMGDEKKDKESFEFWKPRAEKGNAAAQYYLGGMYYRGEGVAKDLKEAVKWYRKAAEQGHAKSQFNLGLMYYQGEGVKRDDKEAVKWYRKAAEQGDRWSQLNLGVLYAKGEGVLEDYVTSYAWINIAQANGYENAKKMKDLVIKIMTPEQIAEGQKLSREMVKKNPKLLK